MADHGVDEISNETLKLDWVDLILENLLGNFP